MEYYWHAQSVSTVFACPSVAVIPSMPVASELARDDG